MKIKNLFFILLFLAGVSILAGCKKDDSPEEETTIIIPPGTGSYDPNVLTDQLDVPNATSVDGNMPPPSNTSQSPVLVMQDSTISYSAGSQIRLPVYFESTTDNGISGVRFQVEGANKYFDMPVSNRNTSGVLLPIGVPSTLDEGTFCITITIYDGSGNVSNSFTTCATITSTYGCDVRRVSGGEGMTSTLHDMGPNPGVVKIEYETYVVPDRIDVFYNGLWVAGTGTNPGSLGAIPPLADCGNPTEGYIGANGTFCFTYDPGSFAKIAEKLIKENEENDLRSFENTEMLNMVEVVVSGCVRGGTRWYYDISCADPNDTCFLGQEGSPRFNLSFPGDVDFDLYVKDPGGEVISYSNPMSASGGQLDVDCICCSHGNENIFWQSGSAPSGQYEYWVHFYGGCSDNSSNYTITITKNGIVQETKTGSLSSVGEESQRWTYNY